MGELSTEIQCKKCGRRVYQSVYDREKPDDPGCDELALKKWNAGMTQEEIDKIKAEKWERLRLREEDLVWKDVHANNILQNTVNGIYALLFRKIENKIVGYKWTIEYQMKEKAPMYITDEVEAYILHLKRYFDVKGPLEYPRPARQVNHEETKYTFNSGDINDYGDFIRSYKTLEEAKLGALERCGCYKLNKETIIKTTIGSNHC